ncbi:hypothetical protein [Raineyella sp. LH-20]|uniref:hypothetical protein n=1 Tax=Raineyella sp. LH-20 TaxID=3081204 RepID=UPI0029539723|nr:hypothetical protein [Raineyella sp. LH-20]WOP17701.1 hypothetical protein R0146_10590 [Raineyella sp. LH-20]
MADGLRWTWSAYVEAEADDHARGQSMPTSTVRATILQTELSPTASTTNGLTTDPKDRQVIADAIEAGARYLITTDVDDFALADLAAHEMSAVNPDYFMALRLTENAYRKGVGLLAAVQSNPARTEAELHRVLGRRHPHLTTRFAEAYDTTPVEADPDQPNEVFRGVACIRCDAHLDNDEQQRIGLCAEHLPG